jgi:hypothetical protein
MQDRIPVARQLQLRDEMDIDVKLVSSTVVAVHPCGPQISAMRRLGINTIKPETFRRAQRGTRATNAWP